MAQLAEDLKVNFLAAVVEHMAAALAAYMVVAQPHLAQDQLQLADLDHHRRHLEQDLLRFYL